MSENAYLILKGISKSYVDGDALKFALKAVDLTINKGEFVAIVGHSGSGKSTLMNIIGCLDNPTSGDYSIAGMDISKTSHSTLSDIRNKIFGFIFQKYHLIPYLTSSQNVQVPALYNNISRKERVSRAEYYLQKLGIKSVSRHLPNQMSGGQQQRVSIARSLINDPEIILADEPTGALDSISAQGVMNLLKELHQEGKTIIMVTHNTAIAKQCDRIIEICDGRVKSSTNKKHCAKKYSGGLTLGEIQRHGILMRMNNIFINTMSILSLNRMSFFLSLLGIIIGIATVVSTVSIGQSIKETILDEMSYLSESSVRIFPVKTDDYDFSFDTLSVSNINSLSYVSFVSPYIASSESIGYQRQLNLIGVSSEFFKIKNFSLIEGRYFSEEDTLNNYSVAVISESYKRYLFDEAIAIGKTVYHKGTAFKVIGVAKNRSSSELSFYMWVPHTILTSRIDRSLKTTSLELSLSEQVEHETGINNLESYLSNLYSGQEMLVTSDVEYLDMVNSTTDNLTLFVTFTGFISLIVGGIGIMNIMLASVSERYSEIGIRMAVGSRKYDILEQFLLESLLITLIGGLLGTVLSMAILGILTHLINEIDIFFSYEALFIGLASSTLTGVLFGYLPASKASNLTPLEALER